MAIDIKSLNHNQLGDLIARAEARIVELKKENTQKVRQRIAEMARAEGLDLDDVLGRSSSAKRAKKSKVKAKYRNPADPSQQWSGRGRQPLWFAAALKSGKREKSLLIP